MKFIVSQFEDLNFENFLREHAPVPSVNGLGLTVEFKTGKVVEKSGNLVSFGEWKP